MSPKMDMSEEKPIQKRILLDEGWRKIKIVEAKQEVSKAGNDMIVFEMQDDKTGNLDKVYAVTAPKKRWVLKSILDACGVKGGEDGVYDFELSDVIGKDIAGLFEHEENVWINREGNEITSKQHRIVEFKAVNDAIAWDE